MRINGPKPLRIHLVRNVEISEVTVCGKATYRAPPMVTHTTAEYEIATCMRCRMAYRKAASAPRWKGDMNR